MCVLQLIAHVYSIKCTKQDLSAGVVTGTSIIAGNKTNLTVSSSFCSSEPARTLTTMEKQGQQGTL